LRDEVSIELLPLAGHARRCSGCALMAEGIHDVQERWVRDLPAFVADCRLLAHRARAACPQRGPKLEDLPWLEAYARVTVRLAESVARLCRLLPIKHVAQEYALSWKTVKAIGKAYLIRTLGPVNPDGLEQLATDAFAIRPPLGHRYATVVLEPSSKRVVRVGRGRSREDVRVFLELPGPERCGKPERFQSKCRVSFV